MTLSPQGHGFHRGQARRRARDRAGLRRAADAARHSRRQHLRQLRRGQPHLLAPDGAAAGRPHRRGAGALGSARPSAVPGLSCAPDTRRHRGAGRRRARGAVAARVETGELPPTSEARRRQDGSADQPPVRGTATGCTVSRDIVSIRGLCDACSASSIGSATCVLPRRLRGHACAPAAAADIRMLFQHDPAEPIGALDSARRGRARPVRRGAPVPAVVQRGREHRRAALRRRALDGLSIGFRTPWPPTHRPRSRRPRACEASTCGRSRS